MRFWLLAIAACGGDPAAPPATPIAVAPAPDAAPVVAKPRITKIDAKPSFGMEQPVCVHDDRGGVECVPIRWEQGFVRAKLDRDVELKYTVVRGKASCSISETHLECSDAAPVAVEHLHTVQYGFVRDGDAISWYEYIVDHDDPRAAEPRPLRAMPAIAGGVKQLAVGFRAACVLTRDDAVWCWSDPKKPAKKLATPEGVEQIAIQDPFELCLRTRDGAVSCTPAYAGDELACDKHSARCGSTSRAIKEFDPLARIRRPAAKLALDHGATALVPQEVRPHAACVNKHLDVQVKTAGACALGGGGEVSCFQPCGGTWTVARVKMPAAQDLWADIERGYARTAGGDVYSWPNETETCTAKREITAAKMAIAGVVELSDIIYVISGPHAYEPMRCAITDGGAGAMCWGLDPKGEITQLADPRTLPMSKRQF
jgi:hypothetical protein